MRPFYQLPLWKTAPLLRLLLPLIAGIMLQWYCKVNPGFIFFCGGSFGLAFLLTYFFSSTSAYLVRNLQGLLLQLIIVCAGLWLTWQKDSRHKSSWYGHYYTDSSVLLLRINEPLVEKPKSYKAETIVLQVINGSQKVYSSGKLLVYFAKDTVAAALKYGETILIRKPLQPIRNSGNPGAFDYKRYSAFQQVYQQVYLKPENWIRSGNKSADIFQSYLFRTRNFILDVLRKYISNRHGELGIAEALLIGYKEDLDKDLVQAYSNTGVVHIIAISGLHLGLIFFVLSWIFNRLPGLKKSTHLRVILIITCLWMFSLLTGASASVLRSAVMFTVIVIGNGYFKQSSIYSSLCASAFILLCYNPYYLWDVGFQLSYLAVIGIVALKEPLYRLVFFKNKMLQRVWDMVSITLAAQVATFPICMYYFHQFPNLFLFSNLLAVPLSTAILFGEILLVIISPLHVLATWLGIVITWTVTLMNKIILFFNGFSFSLIEQIYANLPTTGLLYVTLIFCCGWLLHRHKYFAWISLWSFLGFVALHAVAKIKVQQQKKLIVYNVSKNKAVDFIDADEFVFLGDTVLKQSAALRHFHLEPSRIFLQAKKEVPLLASLKTKNFYYQFYDKKMIFLDSSINIKPEAEVLPIDMLLISHNPRLKITELIKAIKPAVIVFDGSNSPWKIEKWKKECEELNLRFHSVSEQGAFIMEIP